VAPSPASPPAPTPAAPTNLRAIAPWPGHFYWACDIEGRFTSIEATRFPLRRRPPASLRGKHLLHDASTAVAKAKAPELAMIFGQRSMLKRYTVPLKHGSGEVGWFRLTGSPQEDENGEFQGYVGTALDVTTEQRLAMADAATVRLMESVMQRLPLGVLVESETGERLLTNQAFSKAETLHSGTPHWAEAPFEGQTIAQLKEQREPRAGDRVPDRDGTVFYRHYYPLSLDHQARGHLWMYEDVTQIQAAQEDAKAAQAEAEQNSEAKAHFMAQLSHEIRTSLNGILGMAEILSRSKAAAEYREQATLIQSSGQHLLSLVNDVLDLSKVESGRLQLVEASFSLRDLLHELEGTTRARAQRKSLAYEVGIAPGVPLEVTGDRQRLQQILLNLTDNAIKFTERGRVDVKVELLRAGWLRFRVQDTGIGIAQEAQERIFTPFSQANKHVQHQKGGTGLGLTICRQLADAMQGELQLESKQGEGSLFILDLPMAAAEENERSSTFPRKASPAPQKNRLSHLSGKRILVVDDEETNLMVAKAMLSFLHSEITIASSAKEAIAAIDEASFDLVLLDLRMPEISGYEAMAAFQERNLACPVIALTAHASTEDKRKCFAAGMAGFLTKPLSIEALSAETSRVLQEPGEGEDVVATEATDDAEATTKRPALNPAHSRIDFSYMEGIFEGDAQLCQEIGQRWTTQTNERFANLFHAQQQQDRSALVENLHAVAGSSLNLGITRLGEFARALERYAPQDDAWEHMGTWIFDAYEEFQKTATRMERHYD